MTQSTCKQRRLCGFLLFLTLLIFLSGCQESRSGALERVQQTGTLRVATDPSFPPFEYIDEEGQIQGLDADIAKELAQRMGVEVHFVTTGYDGLYDALVADQADLIISALYPDPSRTEDFAFSPPYFNAGSVIILPQTSLIAQEADLAGRAVAVVFGTEGHMEALRYEESLPTPPTLYTFESAEEALQSLSAGQVEAAIINNIAAQMAINRGYPMRVLAPPLTDESYVLAVQHKDRALLDTLVHHLETMARDGTLDVLLARWMR
ncbi:MAG: ABC transporter substrate-binding protein [Anaerolineales bacterium]